MIIAVKGSSSDYVGTQKAKSRIFCTLKDFKLRGEGIDSVEHHGISINMYVCKLVQIQK